MYKGQKQDERGVSIHHSQEMKISLTFYKTVFNWLGVSGSLFQQTLFQCCVT